MLQLPSVPVGSRRIAQRLLRNAYLALIGVAAALAVAFVVAAPTAGASTRRYCGTVTFHLRHDRPFKVYAHNASCHKARHVARVYARARTPRHWVCSASLAACYATASARTTTSPSAAFLRHYGR